MTLLLVIWLLQDFVQLLLMGICMVPDVFLLTALFMALLPDTTKERQTKLVWAAFIGGLIWDLRWTNLPGSRRRSVAASSASPVSSGRRRRYRGARWAHSR